MKYIQKWILRNPFFLTNKKLNVNIVMNIFKKIKNWIYGFKRRRELKKRIEELRKRDPFIY
jgi:hypothetical protein